MEEWECRWWEFEWDGTEALIVVFLSILWKQAQTWKRVWDERSSRDKQIEIQLKLSQEYIFYHYEAERKRGWGSHLILAGGRNEKALANPWSFLNEGYPHGCITAQRLLTKRDPPGTHPLSQSVRPHGLRCHTQKKIPIQSSIHLLSPQISSFHNLATILFNSLFTLWIPNVISSSLSSTLISLLRPFLIMTQRAIFPPSHTGLHIKSSLK